MASSVSRAAPGEASRATAGFAAARNVPGFAAAMSPREAGQLRDPGGCVRCALRCAASRRVCCSHAWCCSFHRE
jgi:hypothetical protein